MPYTTPATRLLGSVLVPCLLVIAGCASSPIPVEAPPEQEPVSAPAAPAEPAEPEEEYSNTLRWTTASEVDNFGFDVYRGDNEEGPFDRLTETPIEGAGTTDLTTSYAYEDSSIDPYRVYFYYVESISLQGIREQFTPIIRAKAKLPAKADEAEAVTPESAGAEGDPR